MITAVAVSEADVRQVLITAHQLLRTRGIARGRFVQDIPGRPFAECPLSVDAAIAVAVGHGPYPGCLIAECSRCARADAARHALAHHIADLPFPHDLDAPTPSGLIERWIDHLRPTDDEVLAELDAAAADARGGDR